MRVFLEPADGWVFRENRPFGEGLDNHSRSVFPPSPSVVAGALRTAILRQHGVSLDRLKRGERCLPAILESFLGYAVGPGRDFTPGRFHIREMELGIRADAGGVFTMHPAPADLVVEGDRDFAEGAGPTVGLLRPVDPVAMGSWHAGADMQLPWCAELSLPVRARGLVLDADWNAYLAGQVPPEAPVPLDNLFATETRTGVGLDAARRSAEEGKLYTTEYVLANDGFQGTNGSAYQRPGIVVDVPGLESTLRLPTVLRLGGDGRLARVIEIQSASGPGENAAVANGAGEGGLRFRVILRTPLSLGSGPTALQVGGAGATFLREGELEARLVASAGGPLEYAGGFDLIFGAPKPSLRTVPAGTVLWFEASRGTSGAFRKRFHQRSLHMEGTARWAEGFGLVAIGTWN